MPYEPFEPGVAIGRTALRTTRLGLGGASIGGLYRPVADADAIALVRHGWSLGIRSFDVAPLYGYGAAERRMGAGLAGGRATSSCCRRRSVASSADGCPHRQ